uniref:Uncharacterized protein n=1 Tax=Anguilla anguilla TaxID=7936 RepID=A0A0E9QUK0_ANGAN
MYYVFMRLFSLSNQTLYHSFLILFKSIQGSLK